MTADRPDIREIFTKAVCGSGSFKYQRTIDLEIPSDQQNIQVLGTFVSNAALDEAVVVENPKYGKAVRVKGRYDVHVWYAPDQETRSAKSTVTYMEYIPIKLLGGDSTSNLQATAKIVQKPFCRKAFVQMSGNKPVIRVEIEQDLYTEVIGLTKLKVGISSNKPIGYEPVLGQELLPPKSVEPESSVKAALCYDLKCEDDVADDYEDYEYLQDEYNN